MESTTQQPGVMLYILWVDNFKVVSQKYPMSSHPPEWDKIISSNYEHPLIISLRYQLTLCGYIVIIFVYIECSKKNCTTYSGA